MIGSRHLYLKPKDANLIFEHDDQGNKTGIILKGFAEHASFIKEKEFILTATQVGDEHEYDVINIADLLDQSKNEGRSCLGIAMLVQPENSDANDEFIEINLHLKSTGLEKLKYFIDRAFFSSKATMTISLSVVGMELGYELFLDKFPAGKYLPIVGYSFSIRTWE